MRKKNFAASVDEEETQTPVKAAVKKWSPKATDAEIESDSEPP